MTLTPEIIAILANIFVMVGGLLKVERRLTALETTQKNMVDGLIKTHIVDRRNSEN